ncbi:uncharacterized protein [Rutidosis leptorrhynchoides]|uniref:uncharacterized protein n=1 Tax=Rutidosis leptorrhynchoides TaxID=125765 RepID=UPI003A99F8E1
MVGKSGGQLLTWDKNVFEATSELVSDFFIAIRGKWLHSGNDSIIVNVYGPLDDLNKCKFWDSLDKILTIDDVSWVICGDFNEVRDKSERFNCEFFDIRAKRFNGFIDRNSLVDLPLGGSVSDHCPIMMSDGDIDFGPKPFKVFDEWFLVDGIEKFIAESWSDPLTGTRKDCVFRNKLKRVKKVALDLELKAESGSLNVDERVKWLESRKSWLEKEKTKTGMLKQKARTFGELSKGCNASFVLLIPKKSDPLSFSDYRLISLIGSYYKIVAKMLSFRIRKVVPHLVSSEQSAFLSGRYILDGVLVANEVVDDLKRNKKHGLIFKVDFEKAFDSLSWNYLLEVMHCMGFGSKWCKWIFSCLSSASISILINGSPTKEFCLKRGVRQGDPLSPFLFIIAAEGLNILTKVAVEKGMYKGVEIGKDKTIISHLQYADDTIFFGEWSRCNARNLMYLLECFERASGLKVNYNKSQLFGIGISKLDVETLASWCSCLAGNLPFMYLGMPVGNKMRKLNDWSPVIEKFNKRSCAWQRACPETKRSLWNIICDAGKQVDHLGVPFSNSFIRKIGDGKDTSFWDDVWMGNARLKDKFKRLYRLEVNKEINICNKLDEFDINGHGEWAYQPLGRTRGELSTLSDLARNSLLVEGRKDEWRWSLDSNGIFSVKACSVLLDNILLTRDSTPSESLRNGLIPKKVEVFIWRARLSRIPVRFELDKRGIDLHSVRCPICDGGIETAEHILFSCQVAMEVWSKVLSWWGYSSTLFVFEDIFKGTFGNLAHDNKRVIW